jgi:hypothetical protein
MTFSKNDSLDGLELRGREMGGRQRQQARSMRRRVSAGSVRKRMEKGTIVESLWLSI